MSNPWDRPPIAGRGDPHEYITYRSVGGFISQWENIEVELSHLYAIFIGKYFKAEAYDEYHDQSKTLKQRLSTLEEAARLYFVKHPDQSNEHDFEVLIEKVRGFSERRHEIAHGIVRPYHLFAFMTEWSDPYDKDTTRTCLVPPHYQRDWFGDLHLPLYVYTSIQIDSLSDKLIELLKEINLFKHRFVSPP
jgi:hypothetical protein